MKDAPPDWRPLSDILQELTSFDHRFRRAFNFSLEIESAIANAIRSGEVAVRGRRYNGFSLRTPAFERIEKYLGPKAGVDISLNQIVIPDDGAVLRSRPRRNLLQPQMNFGIFPEITIPGSGAAGRFTDVQADLRGVEKWIFENSLPPWWREASAEEELARELTGVNKQKRAAVLQAIASLGLENLRIMSQNDREAKITGVVEQDHGLRVSDRYVRELYRETLRNVPKNCS